MQWERFSIFWEVLALLDELNRPAFQIKIQIRVPRSAVGILCFEGVSYYEARRGRRDWMGMGGICQQCKKRQTRRQRLREARGQSLPLHRVNGRRRRRFSPRDLRDKRVILRAITRNERGERRCPI